MKDKVIFKKNLFFKDKVTIKFKIKDLDNNSLEAFLIFYNGNYYAYLNKCKHLEVELDWEPNNFFDEENIYIVCATHGALYQPHNGLCVAGPCKGEKLDQLKILETKDELEVFF